MEDIYKNIEEYNPNKKWKILIVFDMIADMLSNKKLYPIVFYQRKKIKHLSSFYYTILFPCSKKYQTKFNTLFCYENSKEKKLQQITFNHSSNIDFQNYESL